MYDLELGAVAVRIGFRASALPLAGVVLGASQVSPSLSEATKGHHGHHAAPYKAL